MIPGTISTTLSFSERKSIKTSSSWETNIVPFDTISDNLAFELMSDGRIKIKNNISKILISALITSNGPIEEICSLSLTKNNSTIGKSVQNASNLSRLTLPLVMQEVKVKKGDIIGINLGIRNPQTFEIYETCSYATIHTI